MRAQLAQHQLASLVTTGVDFGLMCLSVEVFGATPVAGTILSATSGAVVNFTLGRRWIFKATDERRGGQAFRYVVVSAASLGLNALGEAILHDHFRVQYVAARAVVAIVVSLVWNYPMQRSFVFNRRIPI